jgi:adenosylmethionine-8-amino-7-oxononanoate aminotransferase
MSTLREERMPDRPAGAVQETLLWHSQAHMPTTKRREIVLARGEGAYVWDEQGNRLLDAPASLWYCNVGHGRREIAEAVSEQMCLLEAYSTFQRYATRPALDVAARVAELAPIENSKIFLTSGGGDAVDTAAKLVRRYWTAAGRPEKRTIVTREKAYHGLHGFGTSITGLDFNRDGLGPLLEDTARVPTHDADALEALAKQEGERIAAFFCEPVVGTGGVLNPAPGYLEQVQRVCKENDIIFVVDEVITGFGRTGEMFASERFDLSPDILLVAKGITSGYLPMGAVIIGERYWEPFWKDGGELIFRHGLTYAGHASVCAAALANIRILEREGLVERVRSLEPVLEQALAPLAEHPLVKEVRSGIGLLAGVQLHDVSVAERVAEKSVEGGILMRVITDGTLQISPPFVIEANEIEHLASVIGEALDAVARE